MIKTAFFPPQLRDQADVVQGFDMSATGRKAWLAGEVRESKSGWRYEVAQRFMIDEQEWVPLPFDVMESEVRWFGSDALLVYPRNSWFLEDERDAVIIDLSGRPLRRVSLGISISDVVISQGLFIVGYSEVSPETCLQADHDLWSERAVVLNAEGERQWGLMTALREKRIASTYDLMSCNGVFVVDNNKAMLLGYGPACDQAVFEFDISTLSVRPLEFPQINEVGWTTCLTRLPSGRYALLERRWRPAATSRLYEFSLSSRLSSLEEITPPKSSRALPFGRILLVYSEHVEIIAEGQNAV